MKTSAIACAALAGTLGFSGLASAQDWRGDRGNRGDRDHQQRFEQRQDRRHDRQAERWNERRQERFDRRHEQRDWRPGWQAGYQQPHYGWQSGHRVAPRYHRGGYLPYQYRGPTYRVHDWHAHPGLYAPPYGHQWMQVDGEFLLVALATGLIANAILN